VPVDRDVAAALVAPVPSANPPTLPPKPDGVVAAAPAPPGVSTTAVGPTAVAPQTPQAPQRKVVVQRTKPTRALQPGDLVCGECGEGNPASRKFCSRCGNSLVNAVVAKVPWWKRIFRRKPKTLEAGERPWQGGKAGGKQKKKRSGFAKVIRPLRGIIAALALVGSLAYGMYSPFRNWVNGKYNTAKDKANSIIHPQFDPVLAAPGTTSNVVPGVTGFDAAHPASLAIDLAKNTYWVAPAPNDALRPELDIRLSATSNLDKAIIHDGSSDNFVGFHRAKTLTFIYDNGQSYVVQLKDKAEPQTVTLKHGAKTTNLRIVVTDIYPSFSGSQLAITEIELFSKK
jgi:hypothetical protein